MFDRIIGPILEQLKKLPFWPVVEPFVVVALVWGAAQTLVYNWLAKSSAVEPAIKMFLTSYLSLRITIAALGVVAIMLIFKIKKKPTADGTVSKFTVYWQAHRSSILYRSLAMALVLATVGIGFMIYSPNRVSHITVRFVSLPPDVKPGALAYLIYELNRRQPHWQFNVDFKASSVEELPSQLGANCRRRPQLCLAEGLAHGEPFIAITRDDLGGAYFAEHRGPVSVISTAGEPYAPLSVYEYLVYCLILQSMVIHLDQYGGLPDAAFAVDAPNRGGLFQFIPERQALKSSILAARLSPEEQSLLLNMFGADYLATVTNLLTMDWLYSDRVKGNLRQGFDVLLRSN